MKVEKFPLGEIKSNCYVVSRNGKAWVIDPGFDASVVKDYLENENLELLGIYITHGHFDHCGGIKSLRNFYDVLVYAPIKDKVWFDLTPYNRLGYQVEIDVWVEGGMTIPFEDSFFTVYHTPGHSEGSTALAIENIVFIGDTLFYQSIGRTDIPLANQKELYLTIKKIYTIFPDDTIVYPGHGRNTTIGHEKIFNPFVKG